LSAITGIKELPLCPVSTAQERMHGDLPTMAQAVSRQKQIAMLESDRVMMEHLAVKRRELKEALQLAGEENKYWMSSSKASFFLVKTEPLTKLLRHKLDAVEQDLKAVCGNIQNATDTK
jgi:hypothetical protein